MIIVKAQQIRVGKNELLLSPDAVVLGVHKLTSEVGLLGVHKLTSEVGLLVFADHKTPEREAMQAFRVVRSGEAVPLGAPYVGSYNGDHHVFGPCP